MNEIIANLYNQAIVIEDGGDYVCGELDPMKFADLIIKECAELAKNKACIIMQKAEEYAADKEEMINATSAAFHLEILEQEIRKHFGVSDAT